MSLIGTLVGLFRRCARRDGPEPVARQIRRLTRLLPLRRGEARRAMEKTLGLSRRESRELMSATYDHFSWLVAEWLAAVEHPELTDRWISCSDEAQALLDAHRDGGAVILTAHWGNWELLGAWLSRRGYPVTAMARQAESRGTTDLLSELRSAFGMDVLYKAVGPSAGRSWVRTVKRGRWLALLADQDGGWYGQKGTFLGQPATIVQGPASLACLTKAPLLPLFLRRLGPCCHRVEVGPLYEGPLNKGPDIEVCTRWCNALIEDKVRSAPEQWFWFHRRWKTAQRKIARNEWE